jgi:MraZ protein
MPSPQGITLRSRRVIPQARQAFATIETVPFDTSGRFIISPLMRRHGKLDDLAYFSGAFDYIEIWNPTHADGIGSRPRRSQDRAALPFFLEQRGAK